MELLQMGGYGTYIWSAYGLVAVVLGLQWWLPWRKMRAYQRSQSR